MSEDFFGPEWDLANLAAHAPHADGFLTDLVELADSGIGTVVGLLVNGMVVVGTITSPEIFAEELDRERRRLAESMKSSRPEGTSADEWAEGLERFATTNARLLAEIEKDRDRVANEVEDDENAPWDYSSPPRGLARESLELNVRHFLTLRDPQIVAPGQPGSIKPKALRVALNRVVAWWPIPLDKDGRARFQLFTVDES
jgi:hypothetical protein